MHFAVLGSGSKGNSTLIRAGETLLLLDCGFTVKELEQRLLQLEVNASQLNAVLLTHEHSDHCKGLGALARKYRLPVYMTAGTFLSRDYGKIENLKLIHGYQSFSIADTHITPVAVPHDSREPAQFVFSYAGKTLGVLTDLGHITPHVEQAYAQCDALLLEANHDVDMLAQGPYPYSLKARVGGSWGHLNNQQAAKLLANISLEQLQLLVLGHISENNNCPRLVEALFQKTPLEGASLRIAEQDRVSEWFVVG
ncbi:Phosphoribosyl 1,2-cyclic phosphodiesterase [Alteromonadaceae bacterium Bs31]|nr:Phosphoribosyl 1,2-cyclic phosphodiesterase [Alteromonadaceae bacterium Bs31]